VAKFRRVLLTFALIGAAAGAITSSSAAATGNSIPWTSLAIVRPSLVQPSGWGSPIAAQPSSPRIAWCTRKGVEIVAGNGKSTLVSDATVAAMLRTSHFLLQNWNSRVGASCADIALDPSHPKTIYASFYASQGGSIPPVFSVALVTSNLGKSWRYVPPPRGYSLIDFSGFVERPDGVDMVYSHNIFFPLKSGQTTHLVTVTSHTGGESWIDTRLTCSASSACVIFGPQAPQGACGMSEWQQSVLAAPTGVSPSSSLWRPAGEVPSVSQCGSQQLVATTSGAEFLIDRSRANALLYTHNGIHWTTVLLPKLDGQPVGGKSNGQTMTFGANGLLVAVSGVPYGTSESLQVLVPGSKVWCSANAVLPPSTKKNPVSAIQSSETRLVVTFVAPIRTGQGKEVTALTYPLATLRCRV
jgi:hypothetical protein